ncbi:MAG TPA: MBL fold metallo-hydrolase [Pseudolabrys sp.]|nr:MBL fold metallo-hydrolase [Pseudolabrys sp.]
MVAVSVRFWGVRGSLPCPGADTLRYGGNTACIEVRCGDHLVVLDGGSGLRALGEAVAPNAALDADILFSHFHLDHVIGLPFFRPAYDPSTRLRLWSAPSISGETLAEVLPRLMSTSLFPVSTASLKAALDFRTFQRGDVLALNAAIRVRTAALNHPGGATGYRIEHGGKAIVYVSDVEHYDGAIDPQIAALAADADLLVYDANYTDAEYAQHVGWGHSTWKEAVRLADAAKVKQLALFHHDPSHGDAMMDQIGAAAGAARPGTFVAREGASVVL